MFIEILKWRNFFNPPTLSIILKHFKYFQLWAYTRNCVTWPFFKSIKSRGSAWLIKIIFSLSFSPFHNWILVLCFRLRSWNFLFFPYTGFCVRAMQDMRRVHRFLNNLHKILNCTYWESFEHYKFDLQVIFTCY